MKKLKIIAIILVLVSILCLGLVSCKKKEVEYTVSYYDGSTLIATKTAKGAPERLSAPTKTGYRFVEWYEDAGFATPFDFEKERTENVSIYAKYERLAFTVTFVAEGSADVKKTVQYGDTLSDIPAVPERAGYAGSWDTAVFTNITQNMTVNAVYKKKLTVSFLGGLDGTVSAGSFPLLEGESLSMDSVPAVPTVIGKVGVWYVGTAVLNASHLTSLTADLTVTASYSPLVLTVSFISRFGDVDEKTVFDVDYGEDFDIGLMDGVQPVLQEGHTGVWNVQGIDFSVITKNIEVFALYTPYEFSVTFISDRDGVDSVVVENVSYGSVLENIPSAAAYCAAAIAQNPSKYENIRWASNAVSGTDAPITSDTLFFIAYDTVAMITLNLNNAALSQEAFFAPDSVFSDGIPEKFYVGNVLSGTGVQNPLGYKLLGWKNDFDDDIYKTLEGFIIDGEDFSFTAQWKEVVCEVSFPSIPGITFVHTYTQPLPYGSVFEFTVSAPDTNINNVLINGKSVSGPSYSVTLTEDINIAVATDELSAYNLTFFDADGSTFAVRSVTQGQRLGKVPVPDYDEDVYAGVKWIRNGTAFDFSTEISSTMFFSIEYIDRYYMCYLSANDISVGVINVEYGVSEGVAFAYPEGLVNQLFAGWFMDEECTVPATKESVALYGKSFSLYPKLIPYEDYAGGSVVGVWTAGDAMLEFLPSGLVKLYFGMDYYELSYKITGQDIFILDMPVVLVDGDTLIFDATEFSLDAMGDSFIVAWADGGILSVTNQREIADLLPLGYTWYYDADMTVRAYIPSVDSAYIARKLLILYSQKGNLIKVNLNPLLGGSTVGNVSSVNIYVDNGSVQGALPDAQMAGKVFKGWSLSDGTIVNQMFLIRFAGEELDVYANYYDEDFVKLDTLPQASYALQSADSIHFVFFDFYNDESRIVHRIFDMETKTYTESIPYYYTLVSGRYFDDAGNEIVFAEGRVSLTHNGQTQTYPEYTLENTQIAAYYQEYVNNDGDSITNVIHFNLTKKGYVSAASEVIPYIEADDGIYYIDSIGNVKKIDFSEWTEIIIATVPAGYAGEYYYAQEDVTVVISTAGIVEYIIGGEIVNTEFLTESQVGPDTYLLFMSETEITFTQGGAEMGPYVFVKK